MHVKFSCAVPFEEKKNMVLQVWALRTIVWGWRKLHNMATKYLICNDIANSDVIILTLLWAQKNDNTSKVGGLSLCYSCAVCMMLATLDMTARSCFNQWRQPDARHQLKLFHLLLPTNVNIELQSEALRTYFLWGGGGFNLKVLRWIWRISLVVSLWGSDGQTDFFAFTTNWRLKKRRGRKKVFFSYLGWFEKETRLWLYPLTLMQHLPDTGLFDTVSGSLPTWNYSSFLWMRCKYDDVTEATFSWSYGGAQLF